MRAPTSSPLEQCLELITGRRSFVGSSQASLIAAVMSTNPPPVSTIQPMASPALDRVVRKCLAKSPDDRWQNAGDLLSELEWITESGSNAGVPAPVVAKRRNRERMWQLAAGLAAALLLVSMVWIATHLPKQPAPAAVVHFQIPAPDKLNFFFYELPAVSPDGERIAFTAAASSLVSDRLFVRPLNAANATEIPLPGTDPHYPFWSPDGRHIAFVSRATRAGGTLQRVDISGDRPSPSAETATPFMAGRGIVTVSSSQQTEPVNCIVSLWLVVTRNRFGRCRWAKPVSFGPSFFPMESTTSISP